MGDLTLQHVVLRIVALLLIAAVHGFSVSGLACLFGDQGPRHDGRLSLSPFAHADPIGGLLLVLFAMGWIRPIAIDPARLRFGRAGLTVIVLGSSAATLLLALVARLIRPFVLNLLPDTASATLFVEVETLTQLCLSFTLLNLLPFPPLTGLYWLIALRPGWRDAITRGQSWFIAPLSLFIVSGLAARSLAPGVGLFNRFLFGG